MLNAKADPVWLDFKLQDAGRDVVWVGIVRFEGKNVRWVRTYQGVPLRKYDAARGDVPERPKVFTDPKGNLVGYVLEPVKSR